MDCSLKMADTAALEAEMFSGLDGDDDIWSCFNNIQLEKDILFDDKELDPLADMEIDFNQTDIDVLFWNGSLLDTVVSEMRDDVMWGSPNGSNLSVSPRALSPVDSLVKPQIKEEPQDYVEFEVKQEVKEEPQQYEEEDQLELEPKRPTFGKQAHQQQPRRQRQELEKSIRGASTSRNKTVVVQKTRSLLRKIKKEPEDLVEEDTDGRVKQPVVPDSEHYAASEAFSRQVASFQSNTNPYLTAARFDHNYDMKKRIKTDDLGVQTPSDTEKEDDEGYTDEDEEIDVVNTPPYSEWTPSSSPSPHSRGLTYTAPSSVEQKKRIKTILPKRSLPNNPSRQRRYELEQSVAHSFGSNSVFTSKEVRSTSTTAVKRKIDQEEEEEVEDKDEEEDYDLDDEEEEEEDSDYETGYSSEQGARSVHTKRGKRLKMSPSWSSEEEKRAYHNQMERKRRQDLKSNLERLKGLIPELKSDPRASKQNILNQAVPIVLREERTDRECTKTKELLRQKQAVLKHKVRRLRKVLRHLRERRYSMVAELIN